MDKKYFIVQFEPGTIYKNGFIVKAANTDEVEKLLQKYVSETEKIYSIEMLGKGRVIETGSGVLYEVSYSYQRYAKGEFYNATAYAQANYAFDAESLVEKGVASNKMSLSFRWKVATQFCDELGFK